MVAMTRQKEVRVLLPVPDRVGATAGAQDVDGKWTYWIDCLVNCWNDVLVWRPTADGYRPHNGKLTAEQEAEARRRADTQGPRFPGRPVAA